MPILTVRLSTAEEKTLLRRARLAKKKKATFVRELIRDEPFTTGADLLKFAEAHMGDIRFRISPRK